MKEILRGACPESKMLRMHVCAQHDGRRAQDDISFRHSEVYNPKNLISNCKFQIEN